MKYWKQDSWDILKALLCSYLEVQDSLVHSRDLPGSGQVCSLVLSDCDTKTTAQSWNSHPHGRTFLPALPGLILMSSLSETEIPTTSWRTENNNDQIPKAASWTHKLGTIWEELLKAKGRAWLEMTPPTHPLTVPSPFWFTGCTPPCPALSEHKVIFSKEQAREHRALACLSFTNKSGSLRMGTLRDPF